VEHFIESDLDWLKSTGTAVIANVAGKTLDDYKQICEKLDGRVDMVELNISCPNVKSGGMAFGIKPDTVEEVTRYAKNGAKNTPLIVKLSPNVESIAENARRAEKGGADCVSLINTLTGMAIDIEKRKRVLSIGTGGLSGPAVKPVALRMVYQVARAVQIPVIGLGGISNAKDAIEFLLAGASAIEIGTANFLDPAISVKVAQGINEYLDKHGFASVKDIVGICE
jgi:dihydroorotate dehydrogenase (NAD+) catalytic subunit